MQSIAIIGTGIAGMGCGYFLHKKFQLTYYEKNNYIGGHTYTQTIDEDGKEIKIDAGFIVYNEVTYPNLTRLFKELDVKTKPTSMSFSVQHVPSGLEFSGSGFNGLFSQRKNILSPQFLKMLLQINRFGKECEEVFNSEKYSSYTVAQYVMEKQLGEDFLNKYIVPMSSAIWSTDPSLMVDFPVVTLVRFFKNHGFLGLYTQHQWRTVVDGSWQYRDKLIAPFRDRIHVNRGATKVVRENGKAIVHAVDGSRQEYDKVIFACHADEALQLLDNPKDDEVRILKQFRYQKNMATMHTDASVMPKTRRAWSSWNYRLQQGRDGKMIPDTIYHMNSLQQVSEKRDYFISINNASSLNPAKVLREIEFHHPIYSLEAIAAQKELNRLNDNGITYFCGSYFNYGFHEDAFTSGLNLARKITGEKIW